MTVTEDGLFLRLTPGRYTEPGGTFREGAQVSGIVRGQDPTKAFSFEFH